MADRGNRGGGRGRGGGRFQQQPFPNRGGGQAGGQYHNQGHTQQSNRGQRGSSSHGTASGGSTDVFRQSGQITKINQVVTKLESESFSQTLAADFQQLNVKRQSDAPIRPAYGSQGRKITLLANYFEMLPDKSKLFHRYDMSMASTKGEEPTGKKLERCVRILMQQFPSTIPIATDYRKYLIAAQKLPFDQRQFIIQYYPEGQAGPNNGSPNYRVNVQYTGSFTFSELVDYLSSTDLNREKPSTREEIIQATNIIVASGMKSGSPIVTKRNKYFPAEGNLMEKWMLSTGLEAFRGFFMSVRAATGRILLNVQVHHVVVWQALPMLTLLTSLSTGSERLPLSEINRMISGLTVQVAHLNNRIKRVAGFAMQGDGRGSPTPPRIRASYANAMDILFWRTQPAPARYISVADHFKEIHAPLRYPQAYLLNVGTRKDPVYIPSEHCTIKSLQTYDKKLSPDATEAMRKIAVRNAPDNAQTIVTNGIALLQQKCQNLFRAFGININPSMITIDGRVLPGVAVQYSAGKRGQPKDGSWNMYDTKFHLGASVSHWSYIWLKTANGRGGAFNNLNQVTDIVNHLRQTMEKCGMKVDAPAKGAEFNINNAEEPDTEVNNIFKMVADNLKPKLLLVIIPTKSAAIYNAVKRAGDIRHGIHTVVVIADRKKFCRGLPGPNQQNQASGIPNVQYHANVALKINLKCGGRNQVLQQADLGFVKDGKTMLVGLDVTHPSPDSAKIAPSVSCITASIDPHLSQWPADVAIQTGRKEMIVGLKKMLKTRLVLWQKHNQGVLPEELLIYRDGVGEGMYDLVRTQEMPLIREACKEVYPAHDTKADKPYLTIIICGKRHHTRFYPTDEKEADPRTGGTKNGTIVDRGVTEARQWDFYFQAHTALQGTPRSAHYVVIHDEIFRRRALAQNSSNRATAGQRAADEVQRLTNALSHMYGRATKAVSLCPPAYYADIACERARAWLSDVFDKQSLASSQVEVRDTDVQLHANLRDSMFYI